MSAERVGLVVAGGGVRGAYEAGALSVLLPELERQGFAPSILVGTSVGAINAAFLAATCHLGSEAAGRMGVDVWREVRRERVVRSILTRQAPLTALRYAGEILSLPGVRLPSLLDSEPLDRSLREWIDWAQLTRNVEDGLVGVVATVATSAVRGRTVVFYQGTPAASLHRSHSIDYVPVTIGREHVMASAALPIFFPPVRVDNPAEARGWYVDGGTRLNTPIKPALDFGADRLVVVATDSVTDLPAEPGRHESGRPDFGDGALNVLQGMLVDSLVEDMRRLGYVNIFFAEGEETPGCRGAADYRASRGKPPFKRVPYLFVGPRRAGAIGDLARDVFRDRFGGLKGLRSPDFPLLNRLLGTSGRAPHGVLLSYLFFDSEFIRELVDLGRADAEAWLSTPGDAGGPWRYQPLQSFEESRRG